MKGKFQFLEITVIGGVVFLVPIIILLVVVGKALEIMALLAVPLAGLLPIESIGGFAVANLISIVSIILLCFMAGLAARTAFAGNFIEWIESKVLSKIPIYVFVIGMSESIAGIKESEGVKPVLAQFKDNYQMAFEVERIEGGGVAIFVPGTPNPWSGHMVIMDADRIKPLDLPFTTAMQYFSDFGQGANDMLRGRL